MRTAYLFLVFGLAVSTFAGKRDDQVKQDFQQRSGDERWIYNDLQRGFDEAKAQNKPLFIVYRCIP